MPSSSGSNSYSSSCVTCPKHCLFCDKVDRTCSVCNPGYYLEGARCVPCADNCLVCTGSSCLKCGAGFTFDGAKCTKIQQTHSFSAAPENAAPGPVSQGPRDVTEADAETTAPSTQPNCVLEKIDSKRCTLCANGSYLSALFECIGCPEGCRICRNPKLCLRCEQSHFLELQRHTGALICVKKVSAGLGDRT